jgi:glucose uptake protein GlcU
MPQGLQALAVLLILLPGFLSAAVSRLLRSREKQSDFEKVVEALIFSFITYALYLIIFRDAMPIDVTSVVDKSGAVHYSIAAVRRSQVFFFAGLSFG